MFCNINGDFGVQIKSTNHNARQIYKVSAEDEKKRASYCNLQFVYRPINLRAENQISQLHSRQISAPGDT